MYISNVSFMVSTAVHDKWHDFMTKTFLGAVKQQEHIESFVFSRVLTEGVQDSFTYSLQLNMIEISHFIRLRRNFLSDMGSYMNELFGTEVTHFITIMKVIESNNSTYANKL